MNLRYSFGVYDRSGYIGAIKSFLLPVLEAYGYINHGLLLRYDMWWAGSQVLNEGGGFSAAAPFPIFRASEGICCRDSARLAANHSQP